VRPELPAAFDSPDVCTAALHRLCDSGQRGLVVMGNGRAAAVMAAAARENPAVGRYALHLAEGFAVDPDLTDPTGVLAAAFDAPGCHAAGSRLADGLPGGVRASCARCTGRPHPWLGWLTGADAAV
jgi:hypothetical protein